MNNKNSALVILNGEIPSKKTVESLWKCVSSRICADGAIDKISNLGFQPDILIGDFDSIENLANYYDKNITIIKDIDQETTDSEKAFNYCLDKKFNKIHTIGGLGFRTDHQVYNLSLLKKYHKKKINIIYHTDSEVLFLVEKSFIFNAKKGKRLSLFPLFGRVVGLKTKGLKYEIRNKDLELGKLSSISNEIVSDNAYLESQSGYLLIILEK